MIKVVGKIDLNKIKQREDKVVKNRQIEKKKDERQKRSEKYIKEGGKLRLGDLMKMNGLDKKLKKGLKK